MTTADGSRAGAKGTALRKHAPGKPWSRRPRRGRRAPAPSRPGAPAAVSRQANLGAAPQTRLQWAGASADLDEAIVLTQAVAAGSEQQLVTQFANLGIALQDRFERRGDPADLDAAVAALRAAADAAEAIGAGPVATAPSRANLAGALLARFELRGDRADLDEGVSAARAAVAGVGAAVHHAEGVYLSACQTALGGVELSDEVLHLAAALQFGGFRRVIATLWPVADTTATGVARQIYAALAAGGRFDPGRSAATVRDVTLQLRTQRPDSPTRWAPFVHIGP